jgi:hypothetical protein
MKRWHWFWALGLALVLPGMAGMAGAAVVRLETGEGQTEAAVELGTQLEVEIVVDTQEEELTGLAFFVAVDAKVFDIVPAAVDASGQPQPFAPGDWLEGVVLLNRVELIDDEWILGYVSASGIQRRSSSGQGVAARFSLDVKRRPASGETSVQLIERGHDRVSHYIGAAQPGVEARFAAPLGELRLEVSGFRVSALPDLRLPEGTEAEVFDLDDFAQVEGETIVWTASRLDEIGVRIDGRTNLVTMAPEAGFVGQRQVIFTAFEGGSGLTASDTIEVVVVAPPRLVGFPAELSFDEDTGLSGFALDSFVEDLDDAAETLIWTVSSDAGVAVSLNDSGREVDLVPDGDFFGRAQVDFTVSDADGQEDATSLAVEVLPVNDVPVALRREPVYPVAGAAAVAVPVGELALDVDDAAADLFFEFDIEGSATAAVGDGVVLFAGSSPGRSVIRFSVQDTSGAQATGRLVVVVLPEAASIAPKISPLPAVRILADGLAQIELGAVDEGPAAELLWSAEADEGLAARIEGSRLVLSPIDEFVGPSTVSLSVRDAEGNEDRLDLEVNVLDPEAVLGPQLSPPPGLGVIAGGSVEVPLDDWVEDLDGDPAAIAWDFGVGPGLEAIFDPETRTLSVQADSSAASPASLILRAVDAEGNTAEANLAVMVAKPGEPPQVVDIPQVVLEREDAQGRVDLDRFVFDAEDTAAELEWEAIAEPGIEVSLDPVTHLLRLERAVEGFGGESSQVLLRVRDTDGFERSALIQVQLPPLFELLDLPPLSIFAGREDSSLVLDDYVVHRAADQEIDWQASPSTRLDIEVDSGSSQVRVRVPVEAFQGREVITFTATDSQGRQRFSLWDIDIKGKGLTPQIRPFPVLGLLESSEDGSLDLDDFVVDDDEDQALNWSATVPPGLEVQIDPDTRVLTVRAVDIEPGVARVELSVRDPAGNSASRLLEVQVRRGGAAPQILPLPQPLIAPGDEARLALDPYIEDEDTPVEDMVWQVTSATGVGARIEERRLFISVPIDQQGSRELLLSATDPQGNRAEATLRLLILADDEAPNLELNLAPHPNLAAIELEVRSDESLAGGPAVEVLGQEVAMEPTDSLHYRGVYTVPELSGGRQAVVAVTGRDPAGNSSSLNLALAWRRVEENGGVLAHDDGLIAVNLPDAAAAPGRLALVYRLPPAAVPPQSEEAAVYAVALGPPERALPPVTIHLRNPGGAENGILRWDRVGQLWEELDTALNLQSGWLTAVVDRLGLFRVGAVSPPKRRTLATLNAYPNPYEPQVGANLRVVYELAAAGVARLEIFNILGQPVSLLVDKENHPAGVWATEWDGRDAAGRLMANGIYFVELRLDGQRHRLSVTLLR